MDQRTLDQLVRSITKELADESPSRAATGLRGAGRIRGGSAPAARAGARGENRAAYWLLDNWRVREAERDTFLDFYRTHVAEIVQQLPGYRSGRVLVAAPGSAYAWHVQALYEFESDAVLDIFAREFDRLIRKVNPRLSLEKVLDEMDQWVLGHEDGALTEVWR